MLCSLVFICLQTWFNKVKFLHCLYDNVKTMQILLAGIWLNKNRKKKSGKTLTLGMDMSTEDSVTRTERFIISTALGRGQCDKNRFKETPGSNALSSFTAFRSSQAGGSNNYQGRAWRVWVCTMGQCICVFLCTPLHTHPLLRWSLFTGNVWGASRLAAWCGVTWRL